MKKRILSLCMALALCIGLLPVTALAAGNDRPYSLYVGNTDVTKTEYPDNAAYWTSSDGGTNWTSRLDKPTGDSYIHYNGQDTLTLHNANIQGQYDSSNIYSGYGIYAEAMSGSAVSLTIQLEGTNTVSGWSGIFVHADDGAASLSISGTGSLTAEGTGGGSSSGIIVQGNDGKAELTINNVDVTATNTSDYAQGILLQSADSSPATLTVNGGELTASGSDAGIKYVFDSSATGDGTPTVTVSGNAIVRVNGSAGGITSNSSAEVQTAAGTGESGGIVFDNGTGTVYGDVELQEDLEIGEGESLTLDDGASLNTGDYTLTVDGGTLTGNVTGKVTYKVTGVSLSKDSLTLDVGGTEDLIATITPETATDQNLTWSSNKPEVATVENGTVKAVGAGEATITVKTTDGSNISDTCTVKVNDPVYNMTINPTALDFGSVYTGYTQPAAQTVTITNTGNQPLTLTQPTSTNSFEVGNLSTTSLPVNGTATFTVQPKAELAVDTYSENITVSGTGGATVSIPATFTVKRVPPTYGVTVLPTDNGTVTCYAKGAEQGATVTVNVKPHGGYHLEKLVVTDAKGNVIDVKQESYGTYTFVMPATKVTIAGVFVKNTPDVLPFTDVKPTDWFYNSVKYVYDKGLMDGVEGGQFAPNATLNRAMLVTILYRLDGQPAVSGDMPFTDVPAGTWYTNAVKWASDNGIVNGMEAGQFAPSGDLTREQMAAILYRYAQYKKWDVSASADLTAFVDGDKTSSWAADAMKWAVGAGLINGLEGNTLAP